MTVQHQFHLISHRLCPYVQRSVIVLQEKNIAFRRTDIDLSNPPAWFLQLSPLGRVPLLQVDDDRVLFESAVICEFLDEVTPGSLHPPEPLEKARHRAWIEFGSSILDNIGALYNAPHAESFADRRMELLKQFQRLENELCGEGYFSADGFRLIDAVYGPVFRYFDVIDSMVDLGLFDQLPKVRAWRRLLQQRPSIGNAVVREYPELLLDFLRQRDSYISGLIDGDTTGIEKAHTSANMRR